MITGHISKRQIKYFQKKLILWFEENGRKFPWRKKRLSNYQRIISEVLLQRTKAETVAKFYPKFIKSYPSWKSLASVREEDLKICLKPLGLYKQRAPRLLGLAKEIARKNGRFPKNRKELETIPFVGQYIANAILLFVHNNPEPLLDVNMARLLERFFGPRKLVDIRDDPYLQNLSKRVVDHENPRDLNWAILDFATIICKVRNPLCTNCILKSKCEYFGKNFIQLN